MHRRTPEIFLKGAFLALVYPLFLFLSFRSLIATSVQTCLYTFVTYGDTQDRSPSNPSYSEWGICWPVATWYISWHVIICLSVVSLPSRLFTLECGFLHSPGIQADCV
jgi:hypothetical protein